MMKVLITFMVVAAVAHSVLPAAVNNQDPASTNETYDNVYESLVGSNSTDPADMDELGQVIETLEQKDCPRGFTYSYQARKCYMVVTQPANSWFQAQAICIGRASGAHLAELDTIDESEGLVGYLRRFRPDLELKQCKTDPHSPWEIVIYLAGQRVINGHCSSPFVWKPYPGLQSHMTFTNWHSEEPNCVSLSRLTRESCVTISPSRSYSWNDLSCELKGCYVCQYTDKNW